MFPQMSENHTGKCVENHLHVTKRLCITPKAKNKEKWAYEQNILMEKKPVGIKWNSINRFLFKNFILLQSFCLRK